MRQVASIVAALAAGLLFGAGLSLSRMIDPAVVLSFLDVADIATGGWNPALAFVMASALAVAGLGFALTLRRRVPLFTLGFALQTAQRIDKRLVTGAALFGLGWGLAGYCPGPAIAGLGFAPAKTWLFVIAMLAGMALHGAWGRRRRNATKCASKAGRGPIETLQ